MQELNIYGDISGGYIFNEMDKFAHDYAIQDIGHCVTASANIIYYNSLKQGEYFTMDYYFDIVSPSKYSIYVTMVAGDTVIATASFLFIKRK